MPTPAEITAAILKCQNRIAHVFQQNRNESQESVEHKAYVKALSWVAQHGDDPDWMARHLETLP